MMLRTLYSRLALTLFLLFCVVGVILVQLIGHASTQYQQEVSQKLNATLAEHIVADQPLIKDGAVNRAALDALFHQLMVVNPSIEVYLLDPHGSVIGYSAPEEKIKRRSVSLDPVQRFLDEGMPFPVRSDDPRSPVERKVFSAARIMGEDGLHGYLYIVLGGEQYDNVVEMLGKSFILDSALTVLAVSLTVALLGGLVTFAILTRPLRLLRSVMRRYVAKGGDGEPEIRYPVKGRANNEIDELGLQFNAMAEQIDAQIHELRSMDSMRRQMVANISHDLRTPLTTMRGYLETLLRKTDELSDGEREQYLRTALNHSERLGRLVEELFELARLDSSESVVYAESFSMSELVQDVAQAFLFRAEEKGICLEAHVKPEVPLTYGDIGMMQRVLENLLENGLRNTPEGGHINIGVDVDSGNVVVRVSDTGCGISEDDVPRIFERFYQRAADRPDGSGTGLGLAIVKRILELHGSMIEVHSEIDRGTTFSFHMRTGAVA